MAENAVIESRKDPMISGYLEEVDKLEGFKKCKEMAEVWKGIKKRNVT